MTDYEKSQNLPMPASADGAISTRKLKVDYAKPFVDIDIAVKSAKMICRRKLPDTYTVEFISQKRLNKVNCILFLHLCRLNVFHF